MSVEIDSLFIKVETNSSRAVTAIEELIRTLERLKTVAGLDRVSESMERVSKSIHKVSEESKESSKSANKLSHSLASVAKGLAGIIANAFAINTVGEFLGKAYAAAVEWDGISSRFGDGFGEQADEVYAYVMKLSNALYINDQAFMKYAGNFATLARGFGVAEENIAAMSVGLTEMAYDIYAKNNDFYTFEEAMDAVRSAMVGEIEPIRRAGISITEATMKEYAAMHGITKSVESMTEAEKAVLRYAVMMEQAFASGTVGTFAEELGTVEGMSRALKQQLMGLVQTLGSVFMPILAAIMPYLQAFVTLLTMAIKGIASFFGVTIKSPTWSSGMGDLADSAGATTDAVKDTTSAIGGAANAAKKLKDYTMGFDELNVIKPQDTRSSGGGGGAGGDLGDGDLGLDLDTLWSDEILKSATNKAQEIADSVLGFIEKIKPYFDDILDVVLAIGAGIAAWLVADMVTDIIDAFKVDGKINNWFKANKVKIGVSLIIAGVTLAALGAYDLGYEGPTWENVLKTAIGSALIVGGSLLTFGTGPLGWTVGIAAMLTVTLTSFFLGQKGRLMAEAYGDITLTAVQVQEIVNSAFDFDVNAQIEIVNVTVTNRNRVKKELNAVITVMGFTLNKIQFGVQLSPTDLEGLKDSAESAIATVEELLAANGETVDLAVSLVPPTGEDGADLSASVLSMLSASDETLVTGINAIGKQFTYWIGEGMKDGMTELEEEMILEYGQWFTRINNALVNGKVEGEFAAKMQVNFSSLTRETVGEILKESKKLEEELRETYMKIETEAYAAAVAHRDGLIELEAYYREQGDIVKADEIAAQIEEANKVIEDWDIVGSVDKAMEEARGPVRQMWTEGIQDLYGESFKSIDHSSAFYAWRSQFVTQAANVDFNDPEIVHSLAQDFDLMIMNAFTEVTNGDPVIAEAMQIYGISEWDALGVEVQTDLYNMLLEYMTPNQAVQFLTEAGYDTSQLYAAGVIDGMPVVGEAAMEVVEDVEGKFRGGIPQVALAGGEMVGAVATDMEANKNLALDMAEKLFEETGVVAKKGAGAAGGGASIEFVDVFKSGVTKQAFIDHVSGVFDDAGVPLGDAAGSLGDTVAGKFGDGFTTTMGSKVNSALGTLERTMNGSLGKINSVNSNSTTIAFDRFLAVGKMASGGFVDEGQLFIAREAGAEMVGSMNNRTAVANNDQIVEGISAGVYNAVRAAMATDNSNKTSSVNIYLDGKQITAAVEKRQRERGATIMTGGVTFGY